MAPEVGHLRYYLRQLNKWLNLRTWMKCLVPKNLATVGMKNDLSCGIHLDIIAIFHPKYDFCEGESG